MIVVSSLAKMSSLLCSPPHMVACLPQIQESVLGEKHKVVSNTRDSLNYVTKSIKNRDSPPPPPSKADAVEAKPESSKGQEQEQEKDSILFGLFDNYLTCNVNIAEEIEAWVEETKRFQDSVHCSEIS